MKCKIVVDKDHEEGVWIYVKERSEEAERLVRLIEEPRLQEIQGYRDREAIILSLDEIYCFIVEGGKVYALTENERLQVKERLYRIEESADGFVKLNQSCIANIKKIKSFDASISGTLTVTFKNGYRDYVSRRQLKAVKERLGLKI